MTDLIDIPSWLGYLFSSWFGLTVGSFLNVVIARLPAGESVVRPRSRCPKCKSGIRWHDNVPLLSYLILLRGKCRVCKNPISARYPLVEAMTGLLFIACYVRFGFGPTLFLRDWPLMAALVAITFIDLDHLIIPDPLSLGGLVFGLATCWLNERPGPVDAIVGAAVGFGAFYLLAWAYQAKTGRAGLGGGDIKLLAMLGTFVGLRGVLATVIISSITGSLIGLAWAMAKKEKNLMGATIPYGPFLVIGGLYFYLLGDLLWFQFMIPT